VPKLEAEPKTPTGQQAVGRSSGADSARGTSQRIAALAVGGLGIAGVGVGGFFGLSAQPSLSDSKDFCNDANFCTPRGVELRNSAGNKALSSRVRQKPTSMPSVGTTGLALPMTSRVSARTTS
jgi:hypothetical protein